MPSAPAQTTSVKRPAPQPVAASGPLASQSDAIAVCNDGGGDELAYNETSITLYSATTGSVIGVRASGLPLDSPVPTTLDASTATGGSFAPSVEGEGLNVTAKTQFTVSTPYCDTLSYDAGLTRVAGVVTKTSSADLDGKDTAPAWVDLNSGVVHAEGFVNGSGGGFATSNTEKVVLAAAFNPYSEDLWWVEASETKSGGFSPDIEIIGPHTSERYTLPSYLLPSGNGGPAYSFDFTSAASSPTVWITASDGWGVGPNVPCCENPPLSYFELKSGLSPVQVPASPTRMATRPGYMNPAALPVSHYKFTDVRVATTGASAAFVATFYDEAANTNQDSLWTLALPNGKPTKIADIPLTVNDPENSPGLGVIRYGAIAAVPAGEPTPSGSITGASSRGDDN